MSKLNNTSKQKVLRIYTNIIRTLGKTLTDEQVSELQSLTDEECEQTLQFFSQLAERPRPIPGV